MTQIAKRTTRAVAIAAVFLLAAQPAAWAEGQTAKPQTADDQPSEMEEGAELMSRGFQMLLEGLAGELEPLKDKATRDMVEGLAQGWQQLLDEMDDLSAYHPPEILPNGDIIIRRKAPEAPQAEGDAPGETEI